MRLLLLSMIVLSGCAHAPAPPKPAEVAPPAGQRLAVSESGFCQVMTDQTIRCREAHREQPAPHDSPPAGKFTAVVAYHRGFCALAVDQSLQCWRNMVSTHYDAVQFHGRYVAVASDNLQVCALTLAGELECAIPANDKLVPDPTDSPAVRLSAGPYAALSVGERICARADDRVDCLWPPYPYSHRPRDPGEYSLPTFVHTQTLRGKFIAATANRANACALDRNGRVACVKHHPFTGEYSDLTAGKGICAKRLDGEYECENVEEQPTTALKTARASVLGKSRLVGLTTDGHFVGEHVPESLRGGFVELQGIGLMCAARADDTVFCEWPNYDDDALRDVSTIEASETQLNTDRGVFELWQSPKYTVTKVHGKIDPRNGDTTKYTEVQHGGDFGCGLRQDGEIKCWLTTEWNKNRARPPVKKFKEFALGQVFGCGITPDDQVKCWGNEYFGAVSNQPTEGKFKELRTTRLNVCATREDDQVVCWGQAFPWPLELPIRSEHWALTGEGACVIDQDKNVQCFGLGFAWSGPNDLYAKAGWDKQAVK